jgi:hypothetical protein
LHSSHRRGMYSCMDMTFSAIRSIKISSTDFSTALRSPDMHTRNQITRVGEQTLKVIEWMVRSRQHNVVCDQFSVGSNISVCKSGPGEAFDGLNKQCRNGFLQWAGMPQSIRFHPLWHGPNGPMAIFLAITVFLTILEHRSNGRDASNGHIASSWRSAILRCSAIPARFKFCKPAFCEVFSGTSCSLSNFSFFLLSFLAFFPVI